jgi:hypothetical protein
MIGPQCHILQLTGAEDVDVEAFIIHVVTARGCGVVVHLCDGLVGGTVLELDEKAPTTVAWTVERHSDSIRCVVDGVGVFEVLVGSPRPLHLSTIQMGSAV